MIHDIQLKQFRSYSDDVFEFGSGVNIIVGPNASGKTNLLEAILMICLGSSYRVRDLDIIQFDQPWARLESDTPDGKRILTIEHKETTTQKKFSISQVDYKRLPLNKTIPVVVFEPDHLRLLSQGPDLRREYIDNLLEQTTPGYATLRRDYRRTLAQRNRLLKYQNSSTNDFFVWNIQLSELGGKLVRHRLELVDKLNQHIQELYQQIAQSVVTIKLNYYSKCKLENYSTHLLHKLEASLEADKMRGYTTHGPHRDDLEIIIGNHNASVSASRGESRTILLALKILELKLLEETRNKKPILLLDDVFSELDGSRRKALTTYLNSYQTFITTTDADIVVQHFMDNCTIIPLGN